MKDSTSSSPKRSSLSSLEESLVLGFWFLSVSCVILINCSSEKLAQMPQGVSKVTQGSSPLPDSQQVGQSLCLSKEKQKCLHFKDLGLSLLVWWEDTTKPDPKKTHKN